MAEKELSVIYRKVILKLIDHQYLLPREELEETVDCIAKQLIEACQAKCYLDAKGITE